MEIGVGLLITIAIGVFLANGGTLPHWFLKLRLLSLPILFSLIACLYLLS